VGPDESPALLFFADSSFYLTNRNSQIDLLWVAFGFSSVGTPASGFAIVS